MALTNEFIVWTDDYSADRFRADLIVEGNDTISFFEGEKEVKKYNKKEFLNNNPEWKLLENIKE